MIDDLGIVIAAAGNSSRFGEDDKLLWELDGLPLFLHAPRNFYSVCPEDNMLIVVHPDRIVQFENIARRYLPGMNLRFVAGAEVRAGSVLNGLKALPDCVKFVAVHDAARPWATEKLLKDCLDSARMHGGSVPAKPVVDTLKLADVDGKIVDTVSRSSLWRVETPQVFELEKLLAANQHCLEMDVEFTDDASIMEAAGYDVYIVESEKNNKKITYRKDLSEE